MASVGALPVGTARRADRERLLKAVERKIHSIMEAVEKGLYSPSMNDRMRQLEAERQALQRTHETAEASAPVMVHPNLAELYRRRVADLERLLADPELGREAMELIRSMIRDITVVPRTSSAGVDLELKGISRGSCTCALRAHTSKTPRPVLALGVWVLRMKYRWLRG